VPASRAPAQRSDLTGSRRHVSPQTPHRRGGTAPPREGFPCFRSLRLLGREKGTGYFFSLPVTIKPGKSPLCREFLEDNKAATPITLLTAVTVAPRLFHKPQDYEAFLSLLSEAKTRHGVKIFGFCLMPNHFHVVLEPAHQTALSQFMQWLLTSHVRRYHQHYGGSGHVWQGRFKSFPVQRDEHLITVLRYVLQNPVRAGLSSTPGEWLWSSLRRPQVVDPWAVGDERQWLEQLDEPIRAEQLVNVRECLNRQRPYGRTEWQVKMASMFGLGSTLRPRGRPRNEKKSSLSPF
jgi:putative transposase